MEKYATTPAIGKDSYENGLEDVGCMYFVSAALQPAKRRLASGIPEAGLGIGILLARLRLEI
jgi:hypothetical protein